ncbi:early endosome antigen 1-like isoform X4 [Scyliorhinus canicula]|uniref:early endosome antigen 1-like isoform X4 n=1 Tax=Scyliorhinus canicula TaxID=7830 RepID=UPI0018F4BD91|nr:early endosome antigen 1-like isoform X4 [Scyliorhinus canicula]
MSTFPNEFHSAKNLLTSVETEFIKNLQQQIYYLELEANFLRAQTKKSFILQPKVELEAERMLHKLQEMRSQVDGLHIELKRKEANLYMLQTEKERLGKQLKLSDDLHLKEKQSLVEEIVQLKRMKEIMDTEFSHKEMEFLQSKQELERQLANLKSNEHKVTIIKQQIEQRSEQEKMIETQLGENSLELLKVQSAHHEMEEKYYSMTATMQNKITHDFRDEIRQLHQQLREKEVMREQDRFLRSKMADDCAAINKENVMLHSQTLELNKQLERILLLEQGKTSVELNEATVRSRVAETENRFANGKEENLQLKRDKTLLVDLITDLQNQISIFSTQLSNKEEELSRIYSEIQLFDQDITTLKSQNALQQSLHFEKWQELSGVSSSMMELTGPMKRCIKTKAD